MEKAAGAPKYEIIAADIQQSIEDSSLQPGEKLPTVVELCDIYGVSKITVKRALEQLIETGFITSRRGSGTYVKDLPKTNPNSPTFRAFSDHASGFSAEHEGQIVTSEIYNFEIVNPPTNVAQQLSMGADDFAYYICRVRKADAQPIVIEYTYMPIDIIPGLKRYHLENSVYHYIQDECHLHISSFHRTVRAVGATEQEAERLDCPVGFPLLEFEQIGFLDGGQIFEYSISRNVGNRYELYNVTLA